MSIKNGIFWLGATVLVIALAMCANKASSAEKSNVIELKTANTVILRTAVDENSVSAVVNQLLVKGAALPAGEPIYLFIDSPGGSVTDGMTLIQAAKAMDREVKTITSFSASMAFITVQNLGERLILPYGILMSHRASGVVRGQQPGEMDTRYVFWNKYLTEVDKDAAKRMGMSVQDLAAKHLNEWWTTGIDAVDGKAADRVVLVRCGKDMASTYNEEIGTIFGSIKVEWSNCPMVPAPLKVDLSGIRFFAMSDVETRAFNEGVRMYFYDKRAYLTNYIMKGKPSVFNK